MFCDLSADNDPMAVGLRVFTPGQPDLEAGVTASTGLFYCAKRVVGAVVGWGMADDFTKAGSIQFK
jgi:hypothetical protein